MIANAKIAQRHVYLFMAALAFGIPPTHAAVSDCKTQVVAKNPTGALKLGAITHPPKGSDYSVWLGVYPEAIAVDSERNVYVGGSVNYRVIKFDKDGSVVRSFRLKPPVRTKRPEISHIIDAIALDRHDNVYINNALAAGRDLQQERYIHARGRVRRYQHFLDRRHAGERKRRGGANRDG